MDLVTITTVTKKEYDCNAHRCTNKLKKLFKVYIAFNAYQGTSIVLCKDHLNELGCAVADALDPPRPRRGENTQINEVGEYLKKPTAVEKQPVGWLKVIKENARKRS